MSGCSVQCGGACCRAFVISGSIEAKRQKYHEIIAWRDADPVNNVLEPWMQDVVTVAEMLVPLWDEPDECITWTCRHFDPEAGRCGIYEQRPTMCREFPMHEPDGTCRGCGHVEPPPMALPIVEVA